MARGREAGQGICRCFDAVTHIKVDGWVFGAARGWRAVWRRASCAATALTHVDIKTDHVSVPATA